MSRCNLIPLPVTPIERLTAKFRDYLHLPDPSQLYILMGSVAANMIEGTPVWIMLIGPPGCGKTELLNSLLEVYHVVECADISGEAALLSGSAKKDVAKDATGGILRQLGTHGGLVVNDFTSVLSKSTETIAAVMAAFRECFSGRWTRQIGGEGGRNLQWFGKLAIFAGVTGKIDQYHQMSAELGERWVYSRFEGNGDNFSEVMMALSPKPKGWREELRGHVSDFFDELNLGFGRLAPTRDLTAEERIKLQLLSEMAVKCRSGVPRDGYTHEIIATKEAEIEIRLATVLAQLLIGMERIGVDTATRWRLLGKVALDSMPRIRKLIVEYVALNKLTIDQLQVLLGCSRSVVQRTVEDLQVHGIVVTDNHAVYLSLWMAERYRKLFPSRV